ncbi:MAG: hypothetical protein PHY16_03130 [Methylobacter sp.]|nr:hypothetical protein [Methylobacter sp.]
MKSAASMKLLAAIRELNPHQCEQLVSFLDQQYEESKVLESIPPWESFNI